MSRKIRSGQIGTNTTNFDNILSVSDDDVQKALETIDDHVQTEQFGGTGITSYIAGDILYADSANSLVNISIGADGTVLKSNGSIPEWGDVSSAQEAAIDVITVGKIDIVTPNTVSYLLPDFSESNNEDFIAYLIDGYGSISNLYIYAGTAPGVGATAEFIVRVNGIDTGLETTMTGTNTVAVDLDSVNVVPGDLVTVKVTTSVTCAVADVHVSMDYRETTVVYNTIDIINVGKIGTVTADATRYLLPNYSQATTESFPAYITKEDGYVNNLRVYANTPCGVEEDAVITLRKNEVDTTLTVELSSLETTESDEIEVVDVTSGDKLTVSIVTSSGCVIADVFISMRFNI